MSKEAYGPWIYPSAQTLIEHFGSVYKTAGFKDGRRIAVAYSPCRKDDKDNGERIWGGNILFREVYQQPDGTLSTKFLKEVLPAMSPMVIPTIQACSPSNITTVASGNIRIDARGDIGIASLSGLPSNYRISMTIQPDGNYEEAGLFLRATDKLHNGYRLELNPNNQMVTMHNTSIYAVNELEKSFVLDVIVYDEFFDVSIDNKRCVLNRLPEQKGSHLFFYVKNGKAIIKDIQLQEIKK